MRFVIQRVNRGCVKVSSQIVGQIGKGLMDSRHYAEAIKYFERTKNMWNDDQKVYRDETSQLIRECKKNL